MKTLDLIQGSPEWHAHRATHFNASDAPAMLGCSPYQTRSELLKRMHTGVSPEVDAGQQRRFDDGHRFEALARPVGAKIIGEDLYPITGSEGELSASFDGLTMAEDIGFEHKTLNDQLRAALISDAGADALAKHYRVQMEQQLLVSGAERILFMASKWKDDELVEEMHAWYEPDLELRAEIIAGWKQFAIDLAAYTTPAAAAVAVVAEPVQALPAVSVIVRGEIEISHNFDAFEVAARDFIEHRLIREPKSDQDFADLDLQIKAMKGAEAALDASEDGWIAQIEPVSTAKRRKDMLSKLMRDNRLMAEKLLASEKERRRGEIVAGGVKAFANHVAALNTRLGKAYMPAVPADFGGAIKGKKSLSSMEDAVGTELARAKIASNEIADRIQANLATLREKAAEHVFLFPDTAQIVLKAADDLAALVTARIAEHNEKERARQEAERTRIREEERQRLEREQAEKDRKAEADAKEAQRLADLAKQPIEPAPAAAAPAPTAAPAATPAPAVIQMPARAAAAPATAPSLSLGQISTRLGFNVTAAFLASLGFEPAGRERASVLFHEADFPHICAALVAHIQSIQAKQAA